jgi:hypothetical protein
VLVDLIKEHIIQKYTFRVIRSNYKNLTLDVDNIENLKNISLNVAELVYKNKSKF